MLKSKIPKVKNKNLKSKGVRLRPKKKEYVVDRQAGLVFSTEKELLSYFQPYTNKIWQDHVGWEDSIRSQDESKSKEKDLNISDLELEKQLAMTLEDPSEIWHDATTFKEFPIFHFISVLPDHHGYHVAVAYVSSEDEPTFVFLHFYTQDADLVAKYQRGEIIFDRSIEEVGFATIEGDGLSEGDPIAMGLFLSMLKIRSDKDVPYEKFKTLGEELRNETIQNPDEIWRRQDYYGNSIVSFIREFPDHEWKDLFYIAVAQEEETDGVHSLLFSFPTTDESLVDRYRQGDNLQSEEVSQESSH